MEFEDILKDIGGWGKYQRNMLLFFMIPVSIFSPILVMANLFLVSVPDHWCYVPEVDNLHLNLSQRQLLIRPDNNPSCAMHNLSYRNDIGFESIAILRNSSETISCQQGWSYDKSNYESTAATKWNLVCDRSQYVNLVFTLHNFGGVIGTPIFSVFSDKFGRKMTYFLVVIVATISDLICPFAPNFSTFCVLRALHGFIHPSIAVLPYLLVIEFTPPEKRTKISYAWNFSWVTGVCILPIFVYLSRSWRVVCWMNAAVGAIILMYWKFVSESPRWLVSRKRYEEAKNIMMKIAESNDCLSKTKNLLSNLKILGEKMESEEKDSKTQFYSFIKLPRLRKHFFILTVCSFANYTIYRIIHYNVLNLSNGNEFVLFFLMGLAEAPGAFLLWFTMEKIGRRWSATGGFFIGGIACALPLTGLPYSDIVSSIIGKMIAAGLFMVTDQQLCELYPTVARSFGIGITRCFANVFAFGLPYIISLNIYGKAIPFIFISLTCFTSAVLASFLPETLNKNLPQTIADAEEFGKDQKYFSFGKQSSNDKTKEPKTI